MSVRKRRLKSGKDSWEYSIELGRDFSGKRLQEKRSGFATMKEAKAAERLRLNEIESGKKAVLERLSEPRTDRLHHCFCHLLVSA